MKRTLFIYFLLLFLSTSCTITQRVHRSGFHVAWHKKHDKVVSQPVEASAASKDKADQKEELLLNPDTKSPELALQQVPESFFLVPVESQSDPVKIDHLRAIQNQRSNGVETKFNPSLGGTKEKSTQQRQYVSEGGRSMIAALILLFVGIGLIIVAILTLDILLYAILILFLGLLLLLIALISFVIGLFQLFGG